jgi:uncharacterized protein YlxP (DUF503 family)
MLLVYIEVRLRSEWCRSLKDKRSAVQPLLSRLHQRFNVSAVEAGSQDNHAIIELAIAALTFNAAQADGLAERLYTFVESATEAEILDWSVEYR